VASIFLTYGFALYDIFSADGLTGVYSMPRNMQDLWKKRGAADGF
jgi:hypothetical protein